MYDVTQTAPEKLLLLLLIPVSWVHLKTYETHIHKHPAPKKLPVGYRNICSVQESKPRCAAQQSNTQPLRQPCCHCKFMTLQAMKISQSI